MSFVGNVSDIECDKNEYTRNRPTGLISKMAAHKLSAEPKWNDKDDDLDSDISSPDNFLTKGEFVGHRRGPSGIFAYGVSVDIKLCTNIRRFQPSDVFFFLC